MRTLILSVVTLCGATALAEAPLIGDAAHGATLFKVSCAACHGVEGRGGARSANLRDPAFLAARSDDELAQAIVKGVPATGGASAMPAFPGFPQLDRWDIVAFLRQGEPRVTDYFPDAALFTAKSYKLDEYARDRAKAALGRPLSEGESTLTVVTFYGHGNGGAGPKWVDQDPVSLDALSPKDKAGYLVFVELPREDGRGSAAYGLALDRDGKLMKIASGAGLARPALDREYQSFVGLGHKGQDALVKPRGKRVAPKVQAAFDRAFIRVLEAVTMADKDERDRHWADQK